MKVLVVTISGKTSYLLDRIETGEKIEDYEFFKSGLCTSISGGYDEVWDGFIEDHSDMIDVVSDMHIKYKPIIDEYIDRVTMSAAERETIAFDISINPLPSEGVHLLTVKPYTLFDGAFGELSYTELNLI